MSLGQCEHRKGPKTTRPIPAAAWQSPGEEDALAAGVASGTRGAACTILTLEGGEV